MNAITYFGQAALVDCDRRCDKAWGRNSRPRVQVSADEDDYAFLADHELGTAPADPGTYEGPHGKPTSPSDFPNKWCVRECERCVMWRPAETQPALPDFSGRVYNKRPDPRPEGEG